VPNYLAQRSHIELIYSPWGSKESDGTPFCIQLQAALQGQVPPSLHHPPRTAAQPLAPPGQVTQSAVVGTQPRDGPPPMAASPAARAPTATGGAPPSVPGAQPTARGAPGGAAGSSCPAEPANRGGVGGVAASDKARKAVEGPAASSQLPGASPTTGKGSGSASHSTERFPEEFGRERSVTSQGQGEAPTRREDGGRVPPPTGPLPEAASGTASVTVAMPPRAAPPGSSAMLVTAETHAGSTAGGAAASGGAQGAQPGSLRTAVAGGARGGAGTAEGAGAQASKTAGGSREVEALEEEVRAAAAEQERVQKEVAEEESRMYLPICKPDVSLFSDSCFAFAALAPWYFGVNGCGAAC